MATSGRVTVKVTNYNDLVFEWKTTSQSIENNTSTVTWKMYLTALLSGTINSTAAKDWSVTIDHRTYTGTNTVGINGNSTKILAQGTITMSHEASGVKSFDFSFSQEFDITFSGVKIGTKSGLGRGTLNTIIKASQPTITWPYEYHDFGNKITINTNRMTSALTHTVRYAFGSQSGTIAENVGASTTWTIPLSLMHLIPNSTSGSGRIYVDTYSAGTLVGTKYTGFTAYCPSSIKPSCSVILTDIEDIDDIYGKPVKGLSKINVKVYDLEAYSSPITSHTITIDGHTYSGTEITTSFLEKSGSSVVSVTVTDKRGRTGTWTYTMTVLDYDAPIISKLSVGRCNEDGTANDQGGNCKVTFNATVSAMSNSNTAEYKLRYKKSLESVWSEYIFSYESPTYSVTAETYIFAADPESSYDVELVVEDRHYIGTARTSVSTASTVFDLHHSGTGICFGGVSERKNTLQNNFELLQCGNRYCFSSPGTAGVAGSILMARIEHTDENADSPITFVFSRRLEATPMTVHVQFKSNSTTLDPDIKGITYEGSNYGAFIVKSATSTWDLYVSKVSQYDTITLQDWYTSATTSQRMKLTFPGTLVSAIPEPFYRATPAMLRSILDYIYPIGSIYLSYSHNDPSEMFGGSWARITNAFLWATDASGTIGQTGGEEKHTLTVNELPEHTHGSVYSQQADGTKTQAWFSTSGDKLAYGTVEAGGGEAHNNMPPYIQVSVWRRTA